MDIQTVTTPEVNQEAPKSKLGIFALIGVVLVTAIAGGVYYFGFAKDAPPALPSQGGLQGSISNQATGFYEYAEADVKAHKAETGTKAKISPKRGVSYPYITENSTMGDLLTKDTVPVKGTAVMYGYWDNSVSKWVTTQQTVKAWAAVTTPLSGTGLTTGKGVLKAGRAIALITNVTSLDAYKLADPSVEPSATLAKAAVDSLAEGWHLVPLNKAEFDRVKKSFNYSSLWMLNADGNFVEVPATFESKDLKDFVFWLKFNFKPTEDAAKPAEDPKTDTTLPANIETEKKWEDKNLLVGWREVTGATEYKVTVDGSTTVYTVGADGKTTADAKVITSKKESGVFTITLPGLESTKDHTVKVTAYKDTAVIAETNAEMAKVPAKPAGTDTTAPADIQTDKEWKTTDLLVVWGEVKDATKYIVTVDGSTTPYTVGADGKTTADAKVMTSAKNEQRITITLLGLDSTKAHTVKVTAYKDTVVIATTNAEMAKVPAKPAEEVPAENAAEPEQVEDTLTAGTVTAKDKEVEIGITFSGAENKTGLQVLYGKSSETNQSKYIKASLNENNDLKDGNVTFVESSDDNPSKVVVTDLENGTEYTFILEIIYEEGSVSKTGKVTVKGTPKAAEAPATDPLVVTSTEPQQGDWTGKSGPNEYGPFTFKPEPDNTKIDVEKVSFKFIQGDCALVKTAEIFQKVVNATGKVLATCTVGANGENDSLVFAEKFSIETNSNFYSNFIVLDVAQGKAIQLALTKVEYKVADKSYTLDNTANPVKGPVLSIPVAEVVADPLTASLSVAAATKEEKQGATVTYSTYILENKSDTDITVTGIYFDLVGVECGALQIKEEADPDPDTTSLKVISANSSTNFLCATHDNDPNFLIAINTEVFKIKGKTTMKFTPQIVFRDANSPAVDTEVSLKLTLVNYISTEGKDYKLSPTDGLVGDTITITAAPAASLNYGFASLFDSVLDSLFNLFR